MEKAKIENRVSDLSSQNIMPAEEEFKQRKIELQNFPRMLAFYTTDTCNLQCIGCHIGRRIAPEISISDEGYQRIFDAFPHVKVIGVAGAEMFFDAGNPKGYVQKTFSEAEKYPHLRFVGFTNGTLLTQERVRMIVEKFDWIGISIDSPYPDVYKTIRVGARLDQVVRNIKKISGLKAQKGLGRTDKPKIVLSSVIIDLTYKGLLDLVDLADDAGAARIHLLEPWVGTYEKEYIFNDPVKTAEYLSLRGKAVERARELNIRIQDRTRNAITDRFPELKRHLEPAEEELVGKWPDCCDAPWTELYIWRNGEARICCTSKTVIGNINQDSVYKIWNSPAAMDVRKRILKGNYSKDCQDNCHRGYALPPSKRRQILSYFRNLLM